MSATNAFLSGAVVMASMVIALFFLRFWRTAGDRFFLFLALSFVLQAAGRLIVEPAHLMSEDAPLQYLLRLAAYSLILVAVIDKNRRRSTVTQTNTAGTPHEPGT